MSALIPSFTEETARAKVQRAEDLWNAKDPAKVALAYTPDCIWRNRNEFIQGRAEIEACLTRKWRRELDYVLRKELFLFGGNRIAVQFQYEYRTDNGQYYRAYGLEHWVFDASGLMASRTASINDLPIAASQLLLIKDKS